MKEECDQMLTGSNWGKPRYLIDASSTKEDPCLKTYNEDRLGLLQIIRCMPLHFSP